MEIKMLCSVITRDYVNYTHGGVYNVPKDLANKLIEAGYAIKVEKPKKPKKAKKAKEEVIE